MQHACDRALAALHKSLMLLHLHLSGNRRIRFSRASVKRRLQRTIALVVGISFLANSTPAAPQTALAFAKESTTTFAFWLRSNGLDRFGQNGPRLRPQEKQLDRDAGVSRLEIFPGDITVELSDRVSFSAIAYDPENVPVSGIKVKWSVEEAIPDSKGSRIHVTPEGDFEAVRPGSFKVMAKTAGASAQIDVLVRPGVLRKLDPARKNSIKVSSRDLPSVATKNAGEVKEATPAASRTRNAARSRSLRSHTTNARSARLSTTRVPGPEPLPAGDGWDGTNYWSADDPGNRRGATPGAALDGGAGSGNFQFSAPVLNLSGRGMDVSLNLAYNSRLWNKAGTQIAFDNDHDWPAPGWSLGFSRVLGMGLNAGAMIVEADGTRHSYTGQVTSYPWGQYFEGHTTDGSFIDYTAATNTNGLVLSAGASFPNGTRIIYNAYSLTTGAGYPTRIVDANGNYITITYVGDQGPRIQTVTDTLGRVINFYYDYHNLLTAVSGPGLNSGTRTLVRLHYHQLTLNYGFSNLTPRVNTPSPWVVDAIYYPATGTGYWFNDTDSYSTYGMLAKVVEQRNVGFSASSLSDMGNVWAGDTVRTETYNYPLSPNYSLTDAPTYTSMTETWTRDGNPTNTDSAITTYSLDENATNPSQPSIPSRKVEVTLPNQTKSIQYSYKAPGQFNDGLVYQDEIRDGAGTLLQGNSSTWEQGDRDSPRPVRLEATEHGQMLAVEFSYLGYYNQVTEARNYDYGGTTLLRSTRTEYQNDDNYRGRHIFSLPLSVEIYDGNNVRVSRTDYQYDGQTLAEAPGVVMHEVAYDPYNTDSYCCDCCNWQWDYYTDSQYCAEWCPPVPLFDAGTNYRGNLTQTVAYADAVNLSGPVTETLRYDITGNTVVASTACCEQTSFGFTSDTQYAYPQTTTRGSATDGFAQVKTSATYDVNTGLRLSTTDANGRISQTTYADETLRPQSSISPSGAHTDFAYNDATLSVTQTTYLGTHPEDTGLTEQSSKWLNGRGQVRQERALGANGVWDVTETAYDNMGRAVQQSRPYRLGIDQPKFSIVTYDALGRARKVIATDYTQPDGSDGSTTETFYNEENRPSVASTLPGDTTRVVDAWGRERWGRMDALGRLVEVVEPNPSGSGAVLAAGALLTTYSYNALGKLIEITQGSQTRSFKYDSLGRVTAQKLAEASAMLNDAGTYQTSGGSWSDVFSYDERSNVISHTDARGVRTVYNYNNDPLNRLQSVSWHTNGFGDSANPILPAASVSYQYRTKSSAPQLLDVTQLSSITTNGVSVESYTYDFENRLASKTVTLTSRSNFPFVTNFTYDTLDRVDEMRYPAEHGNGSAPRKVVHFDYDIASRLGALTFDGASYASQIAYNSSSQTTSLNVGGSGSNQIVENYNYDSQTGLLADQTVARSSSPATHLLDLTYNYTGPNGRRSGQLMKIINNVDPTHNKDRSFSYDALGRLIQATGGPTATPRWTQTYSYDRYGNRLSISASGFSARNGSAVESHLTAQREGNANPTEIETANPNGANSAIPVTSTHSTLPVSESGLLDFRSGTHRATGKQQSQKVSAHHASRLPEPAISQSGPPVFTDDPLVAGVTGIKAVHITELRTAVNQARSRASLAAANWAEAVTTGVTIKASHITELRARLDEARIVLGLGAATYTDPSLSAGMTIKAVHVQELRQRVTEALAGSGLPIPADGHTSLAYDIASNRITTAGFDYDKAGNQVRALVAGGSSQYLQYDAANRLVKVKANDNLTVIATYSYGDSRERLMVEEGGSRTYYADDLAEYTESGGSANPSWSKSNVFLGARLLATLTPNGSGGETVQYHHPDQLGTRLVTDPSNGTSFEQVNLPFGTALNAESTGSTKRRFTTYDRSAVTGLDYAVNRHYDSQQGRFTQVDPIGMQSASIENPQTLNLYAYCANDPVNRTDPDGMFWGALKRLFRKIGHFLSAVGNAISKVLNNKWVRIGVFVLSFFAPGLGQIVQMALKIYQVVSDIVGQMQLYGMLLSGNFKEWGRALLRGYIGSFVATIENGILDEIRNGIAGGFVNGHYSFKDFTHSVWKGIKTGLSNAKNQLLRTRDKDGKKKSWWKILKDMVVPGYGNYCGPGVGVGAGNTASSVPATDGIDSACYSHEYPDGSSNATRLGMDKTLWRRLFISFPMTHLIDAAFGGRPGVGSTYKHIATLGFPFLIGGRQINEWLHPPKPASGP
jgi:RHS repeat-associated protein